MRLLLDTHALLWWLGDDPRLGAAVREQIADPQVEVSVSAASAWEIAIKQALGRLEIRADLPSALAASGFRELPITIADALMAGSLPRHHRDPFDRILVAQALREGCTIVTADPDIALYGAPVLAA